MTSATRTDVADALAEGLLDGEDLVNDLRGGQPPRKAARAGRAKRAPHGASHLRTQLPDRLS